MMRLSKTHVAIFLLAIVAVAALASCSPRRNNAATRKYQAFITRYNIYYNGDEHFKETIKQLEATYQDDYSKRLYLHPVEAKADPKAPQPTGNFDRSIEKAQKAIQLRSIKKKPRKQPGKQYDQNYKEWMRRSEYNPFLHNAWMMMGRSQYFNGDFSGAAATFLYISKHFRWLTGTVTEAQLWEARCYLAEGWLYEAEGVINRIKPDELTNNTLKGLYHFDRADLYVRQHRYEEAVPELEALLHYTSGSQKMRVNFLLGQVLSELGRKGEAYKAFHRAGTSSAADYRTKFNARIRQSEVYEGTDIEPEVKALRRMTRYDRNKEYLDQVYYAIGNLYMSRRDTAEAIDAYSTAIRESTRGGYDKALASLALGRIYFTQQRYDLAQPCYSEAVPQLPDDYPGLDSIRRRSDVLDELAVYAQNVHLQDSLLTLAAMSTDEQMEVCRRLADEAKRKREEEAEQAKREEYMAEQVANRQPLPDNNVATPMSLSTDKSWYFYNRSAVASGKQAFQKLWGSRKLEDNWRRRNRQEFSMSDFETDADSEELATDSIAASGAEGVNDDEQRRLMAAEENPEEPEYYLKNIPKTDAEKVNANDIVQEGLYNMGLILKDKLEDFDAARAEFDLLMSRYPDNVYRPDVYYNLYLMYVRQGDMAEAEKYRQRIVSEFPESPLGQAMANPDYLARLREMDTRQEELYAATLDDYMANRNAEVHANYELMQRDYPLSKIMPKFMFLEALTYVTEDKPDLFASTLKELLQKYPDTDITPIASAYLKGLAQGRKLHHTASNMRAMVWDTRLLAPGDSTLPNPDEPLKVTLDPSAPQMLAFIYDLGQVNPRTLLYDVARHNFATFVVRDFDLEQLTFGQLGVLLVKGFANERELNHYRTILSRSFTLPPGVRAIPISEANFELLLKQGRSFEEYLQAIGEETDLRTHEAVLPPDEYPSPAEMYPEADESTVPEEPTPSSPETAPQRTPQEPPLVTPIPVTPDEEEPYDIPVPELSPTLRRPVSPAEPVTTPTESVTTPAEPMPEDKPLFTPVAPPSTDIPEGAEE